MKATGRGASGGGGDRDDGGRAARGGGDEDVKRPRGALGVDKWYLGYTRPGPRVYSDLFGQVKGSGCIEIVVLDSDAEERGRSICEVMGQDIDGPTNKSTVYVSVVAGSEADLMSWAVPNFGAPNAVQREREGLPGLAGRASAGRPAEVSPVAAPRGGMPAELRPEDDSMFKLCQQVDARGLTRGEWGLLLKQALPESQLRMGWLASLLRHIHVGLGGL